LEKWSAGFVGVGTDAATRRWTLICRREVSRGLRSAACHGATPTVDELHGPGEHYIPEEMLSTNHHAGTR
jgi:hypothetical protein